MARKPCAAHTSVSPARTELPVQGGPRTGYTLKARWKTCVFSACQRPQAAPAAGKSLRTWAAAMAKQCSAGLAQHRREGSIPQGGGAGKRGRVSFRAGKAACRKIFAEIVDSFSRGRSGRQTATCAACWHLCLWQFLWTGRGVIVTDISESSVAGFYENGENSGVRARPYLALPPALTFVKWGGRAL